MEDKIFYLNFEDENLINISNNKVYNSIFHNDFIVVNNDSTYIIIIKRNN